MTPDLIALLSPDEQAELSALLDSAPVWMPQTGPQTTAYLSEADVIGYGGAAGGGKGLALDTRLPTPSGWTTMGAVQIGQVLFDETGAPCTVTAVSDVVMRKCYRLAFDDGSTLTADDVHRWVTFDAKELAALTRRDPEWQARRRKNRPSRAKTSTSPQRVSLMQRLNASNAKSLPVPTGTMRDTTELATTLRTPSGRSNHAIQIAKALNTQQQQLPIPPYTLGAWLGDGSSANSQLTGIDEGVWQRIESEGFEVRHYDHKQHNILGLQKSLRDLGVQNDKHIPMQYLRADYDTRMALLQGLMDTDGHAALDGGCEYDGINERLVRGVWELVLSLGIKATVTQGVAKLNGRSIGPKWRVKFVTDKQVFGLERKQSRLGPVRRTTQFRYLISCEEVPSVPTKCIAVDSPNRMYLAGDNMIPTHNTDLALGTALTQHTKVAIFRENGTEHTSSIDRLSEILGTRDGWNGSDRIWRIQEPYSRRAGHQVEFCSIPNMGDENKYRGRPHDLLVFEEATGMFQEQIRFLSTWLRTTDKGQRCKIVMTFNPPTDAKGRWVIQYFAPWLDKNYANPAKPGELRWFVNDGDKDVEVPDNSPVDVNGVMLTPQSRTFVPARVGDNKYMTPQYLATLHALPEPTRSLMLYGDFQAGLEDDPWQVIPTKWVEEAMRRWVDLSPKPEMMAVGVDVARGGRDSTVLARKHEGLWFDKPLTYQGEATDDGPKVAGLTISAIRDEAPVAIDVIGVGASPYDFLLSHNQQVIGVNVSERSFATDKSGRLAFANLRSELWWKAREILDPANNTGIQLPPDDRLKIDLCAPKWKMQGAMIRVESREDIVTRIGRSPDYASAYLLAMMDIPKANVQRFSRGSGAPTGRTPHVLEHDPYGDLL